MVVGSETGSPDEIQIYKIITKRYVIICFILPMLLLSNLFKAYSAICLDRRHSSSDVKDLFC